MKIISLQSVGLGRLNPNYRAIPVDEELFVKVGNPNPFTGSEKVVSIELVSGDDLPMSNRGGGRWTSYSGAHYKVTTSDGHIRVLPEQSYIAEWTDDEQ